MSVGKNIKLYLVENNISQSWLSKETNMTPSQLCAALNEERKMTIEEYDILMEKLKLPLDSFAGKKTLVKNRNLTH